MEYTTLEMCINLKDIETRVPNEILKVLKEKKDSFDLCTPGACDNFKFISFDCSEEKQYKVTFSLNFPK